MNSAAQRGARLPAVLAAGPGTGFLLGIDIGGTKVALASMGQDGAPLVTRRIPTLADEGAERVVARILAEAHAVSEETTQGWGLALSGVGAVTPGVVGEHGIALAPNNPGWESMPLRRRLEESFPGVPVAVMNDVRAAAVAEVAVGALVDVDTAVFINIGTGISAAILVGGAVLDGEHGAAGEIAYQQVGPAPGPGFAAGRAPLEELASGGGIADRAATVLGRVVSTREAFELAAADPRLRALIDQAQDALAVQVVNLAAALNPSHIVLGGGLVAHWEGLVPRLREAVRSATPFPPEVLASGLGEDAALVGALTVAGQQAGTYVAGSRREP